LSDEGHRRHFRSASPTRILDGAEGARKSDRTRARLQSAVCDLLEDAVPSDLRVDQVCTRAGTSHGTFYVYFPDIHTLLTRTLAEFVDFLEAALISAGRNTPERPRATTRAYVALFEANRGLMRCLVSRAGDLPEANALFEALNRRWAEMVADAAERFALRNGHPVPDREELLRRAYAVGGMIDQYLVTLFFGTDATLAALSQDREKVVDTFTTVWSRGLAP
jgi:TetR/AcrR family transcriptional regulator, ethionamide resistance regulator